MSDFNKSLDNYKKALASLEGYCIDPIVTLRDKAGVIKGFEYVYELSWVTLKKFLAQLGHETQGARTVFSTAFQLGYLKNETNWLDMIIQRNTTVHTYNQDYAEDLVFKIKDNYIFEFRSLLEVFEKAI